MSEIVFILGAGASAESGAPMMQSFLDVARRLHRTGQTGNAAASFAAVFDGILALEAAYAKAVIDTDNIESVFAAFEMAQLFGAMGKSAPTIDVKVLPDALRKLIVTTIEITTQLKLSGPAGQRRLDVPFPYETFLDAVLGKEKPRATAASFLTFNYDLGLDFALFRRGREIDYGIKPLPIPEAVPLLKLHGSLNWTTCKGCGIAAFPIGQYLRKYPPDPLHASDFYRLHLSSNLNEPFEHCNEQKDDVPLLVPPTWNKGEHHTKIARVWKHAARHLSEARIIVIVGYSLPATDEFFRYLFALGTIGPSRLEHVWVVNTDKTVEGRFHQLLGPLAQRRFRLLEMKFSQSLSEIKALLDATAP